MLGDDAFLLEQLGFGHSTFAQTSACTIGVVTNYFENSKVGAVPRYALLVGSHRLVLPIFSFQRGAVFSVQSMIPTFSSPS